MKPLKIGSLFSGVGGLDLGLMWGLADGGVASELAWHVEMGKYPSQVLAARFPNAAHCDDVFKVDDSFEDIDLLCGGFPCQPISSAGRQMGSEDERFLWPEMVRIADEKKPAMVVFENVGNLLKIEDGAMMNLVIADLHRIGYDVSWRMFSAADVGAPHVRHRVFGLAWRRDHPAQEAGDLERLPTMFDEQDWHNGDWRKDTPILAEPPPNQRERAKCLGNAVVPACARRVGRVAASIWKGNPPTQEGAVCAPERRMDDTGKWLPQGVLSMFGDASEDNTIPQWGSQGSVIGGEYRINCPWDIDGGARPSYTYPTPAVWAGGIDRPNVILDALHERIPGHQLQLEDKAMLEHLRAIDPPPTDMAAEYRRVRTSKRINPEFVEAMMGFPRGWTAK
jgi:DNA (cytosine-5)-methyltransferase 1